MQSVAKFRRTLGWKIALWLSLLPDRDLRGADSDQHRLPEEHHRTEGTGGFPHPGQRRAGVAPLPPCWSATWK